MAQIFPAFSPASSVQVTNFPANQNVTVTNTPTVQSEGQDSNGALHTIQTDGVGKIVISAQDLLERLDLMLQELRALKMVMISHDSTLLPQDFEVSGVQVVTNDQ